MYRIEDRPEAIRAVQRFLALRPSGIYDRLTEQAVRQHQEESGLAVTGVVDYATFLSLRKKHRDASILKEAERALTVKGRFPYTLGDRGNDVALINSMLARVGSRFSLNSYTPRGMFISEDSLDSTEELRGIFLLPEGRYIDAEFFLRLKNEINAMLLAEENV